MLNQIRSEWIKLRTVRSTMVMFLCAVFLSAFFGAIIQIASEGDQPLENLTFGLLISQVFFAVIGVQIIGQEYRFKTIRTTFANNAKRIQVVVAKLIIGVFAISILTSVLGFGIGCILRQPIAGIVVVILWMLVVENVIAGVLTVFKIEAFKWFPYISLMSSTSTQPDSSAFSPQIAILYSGSIFFALVGLGVFLINRRDA